MFADLRKISIIVGFAILTANFLCGCQTDAMVQSQSSNLLVANSIAAPLSLTITTKQRVFSDTQPIQITITLTNNLDTPTRIFLLPFSYQTYHLTTPAGNSFSLTPLVPLTPPVLTSELYPILQPHQSYITGHDLRTLQGYSSELFSRAGIYKVHTQFSQPSVGDYCVWTPNLHGETVALTPVDLVSNIIELERK